MFALLVAVPLYGQAITAKISSIALGLFGVIHQVLMVALWFGEIAPEEIELYFLSPSLLILVVILAMLANFKKAMSH